LPVAPTPGALPVCTNQERCHPSPRAVHFDTTHRGRARLYESCGPWSSLVGQDIKYALETQHQSATLRTDHHENHPKPLHQPGFRLMKDSFNCHRELAFAFATLIRLARTVKTVLSVTASWTTTALWRSKLKQMLHADFLSGKPLLELDQVQLLLPHRKIIAL